MFERDIAFSMPECMWDAVYMAVLDELEGMEVCSQEAVFVYKRLVRVKRELEKLLESVQ